MSVWTSSIPFQTAKRGLMHMVRSGKDIWIINECDVFVLNTELQKLFKVDVVLPPISFIVAVVAHVDKIFFWTQGDIIGHSLYQLDTNTTQVELVIKAERIDGFVESATIIGNVMYCLEDDFWNESLLLHKIDLVEKKMLDTRILKTLPMCGPNYELSSTNNDLYLLETERFENVRTVFKIGKDGLEQLHEEVYRGIVEIDRFDSFFVRDEVDDASYYLDSFDFKTNKWNRIECEYHANWIRAVLKVDDIVYTIVTSNTIPDGNELRMLEQSPSLEKRCILNVIDEIIDSEDFSQVDEFVKWLPPMLKQTASSMIDWRIREYEYLMNITGNFMQPLRKDEEAQNGEVEESQEMMEQ